MEAPASTNTDCGEETINIKRRRGHDKQGLAPRMTAGCSRDSLLVDAIDGKATCDPDSIERELRTSAANHNHLVQDMR
jgi:hypothetical protein